MSLTEKDMVQFRGYTLSETADLVS